ncbi:17230_t:CDS:2 [Funneliformis caledonium]|uniref:17230_t:CDS:1 n=2 Tax=Funneliformis TaxID=1117308 RepID=A0A9N9A1H9_9GLOM|nr:3858_t:CDS:2 [Funneliformis mosseae]CAG8513682.1 17230_t:CDS:2 [Funneliformis caledonium]
MQKHTLFRLKTLHRYISSTSASFARNKPGSGGLGKRRDPEAELYDIDKMPEYKFDAITKPGYDILLAQREVRNYLRITKFELPQLSVFAEKFTPSPPTSILCFKNSYYVGESSPLQNKVVLTIKFCDIKALLTPKQLHKFVILCGPRFNGVEFKFSCDKFPHINQNKKYLSDLVDKLLEESKNEEDMFEDIPMDTRHIEKKSKKKKLQGLKFPVEWYRPKQQIEQQAELLDRVDRTTLTTTTTTGNNNLSTESRKIVETISIEIK